MATKLITLNIRRYLVTQPRPARRKRLSKFVRERIAHYTKISEENVKIDSEMNKALVKFYSKNMLPLKTNVNIENGVAKVSLYSEKKQEPEKSPAESKKAATKAAKATEEKKKAPKAESKKDDTEQKKGSEK